MRLHNNLVHFLAEHRDSFLSRHTIALPCQRIPAFRSPRVRPRRFLDIFHAFEHFDIRLCVYLASTMYILLRSAICSMHMFWLLALIPRAHADRQSSARPVYEESIDNGTFGYYPSWTFMTEEEITAPMTNWLQWDPQCDDGMFYFLTPKGWSISQPGPMILDGKGDLVWSKHFANEWGGQAYDLMAQHYQGLEYLTFWTGDDQIRGHGSGSYMMVSKSEIWLISRYVKNNRESADFHPSSILPTN
jgi:hypothetical protein